MKVGAIIQARLGSTRLPKKILMELPDGMTVLEMLIARMAMANTVHKFYIATPDEEIMQMHFRPVDPVKFLWRGPRDPLGEFWRVARHADLDVIVRITADCPMIDPEAIDLAVALFKQEMLTGEPRLVWNTPDGTDVEVFSIGMLAAAYAVAEDPEDREHVTPWIKKHFGVLSFAWPKDFAGKSLDTREDYDTICKMIGEEREAAL